MILAFRSQPNARSVVEPQTPPFSLFLRHLETFPAPNAFNPLVIHLPSFFVQDRCDPWRSIAPVQSGQFDDPLRQWCFIVAYQWEIPLCRA